MRPRLMLSITGPVFLGSGILFLLGACAAWYLHSMQRDVSTEVSSRVADLQVIEQLVIDVRELRTHLNRYLFSRSTLQLGEITSAAEEVRGSIDETRKILLSQREEQLLAGLNESFTRFVKEFPKAVQSKKGDALAAEITALKDEAITDRVLTPASELLKINRAQATEIVEENYIFSHRMAIGLVVLGVCGGLAGLLVGYGMSRAISRHLFQLSVPIRTAAGKLDEVVGPITVQSGYSFEEVNELLEQMSRRVSDVVQRLHESRQQAVRAEQLAAVGQLAAGLAHELRNPLTAVKILVQSAAERANPGLRSPRDLAVLEEEIGRMEQLVTTFLEFARPPMPKKRLLDVRREIEHVADMVRPRAERIGIHLDVPLPPDPVMLLADSTQLRQLLLNLALNALDAASRGGNVWLSVDEESDESAQPNGRPGRRWLSLRVADDGRGLPPELWQRIFDPFVSTKETGIGLGLSICKRIAEAHDGHIEAIDRPGGGAIFIVRLPLEASAPAPLPPPVVLEIPQV